MMSFSSAVILASVLAVSFASPLTSSDQMQRRSLHARAGHATAVNLGTAINYTILAQSGISTIPTSQIQGNIAVSPIASGSLTGFNPLVLDSSGKFATCSQVSGKVYAANYIAPTPATLTQAVSDMGTAYTAAFAQNQVDFSNYLGGALVNAVLTPGIYNFAVPVSIGANVTLSGLATDVYVIQITNTLTQAASTTVTLTGGVLAGNIVFAVTGSVSIGTLASFQGVVLGKTSVLVATSSNMTGRIYSQTAVTLQKAIITLPL